MILQALGFLAVSGLALGAALPPQEGQELQIVFDPPAPRPDPEDTARFYVCEAEDAGSKTAYVSNAIEDEPRNLKKVTADWQRYLLEGYSAFQAGECQFAQDFEAASAIINKLRSSKRSGGMTVKQLIWNYPNDERANDRRSTASKKATGDEPSNAAAPKSPGTDRLADVAASLNADAEAAAERERLASEKVNAEEAERQRRATEAIVEAKRQQEQRKKEYEAQVPASQAARVAWEEEVARIRKRESEYQDQLASYKQQEACRTGTKGACAASTDTDANQCVSSVEIKQDAAFKGNTSASVVNGCERPVDVRICLKKGDGTWNCGVGWAVAVQTRFSYSSFNATGQTFVDAKTSGGPRTLAQPQ